MFLLFSSQYLGQNFHLRDTQLLTKKYLNGSLISRGIRQTGPIGNDTVFIWMSVRDFPSHKPVIMDLTHKNEFNHVTNVAATRPYMTIWRRFTITWLTVAQLPERKLYQVVNVPTLFR